MMEHYVTLFDSMFLPQGLALQMSMERHIQDYNLWILCVDDDAHDVLTKLQLPNVRLMRLGAFETEELLSIKPTRSNGEYCWTLTPFAPRFVFEVDSTVERVTYLDADLWFRKNPRQIFAEFAASGKHVLITDHAYAAEYDQSLTSGQYCVQFMTFTRHGGARVREWWEGQCIKWCYARVEDGKFGDQKYLDDWPDRFEDEIHVLQDKELALAPWNATRFPYGNSVFFHFQCLRITSSSTLNIGPYSLPEIVISAVYRPYIFDLRYAISKLQEIGYTHRPQAKRPNIGQLLYRRMKSFYRLFRLQFRSDELSW